MARVLLDKNMPRKLARLLSGHQADTADRLGWGTLPDSHLLAAAEQAGFDVLVTADQSIRYQQNLSLRKIGLVVLSHNAWPIIRDNVDLILNAINRAPTSSYREVSLPRPNRK